MNPVITNYLSEFEFGEIQYYKNMAVIPVFTKLNGSPEYLTLKEALEEKALKITEINSGGSVPELKVLNKSKKPILLLDGEELSGAKQNRILNTTILLKKESETIIPVSCTEEGRWDYVSDTFGDSDVVASPRLRSMKLESVSQSLAMRESFGSDQGAVWDEVDFVSMDLDVDSPTSAMKAIFTKRQKDIDDYLNVFEYQNGQNGIAVFIDGDIVGIDFISYKPAYKVLHQKLIKSYVVDAIRIDQNKDKKPSLKTVKSFMADIDKCNEKKYKSVGHGWDHRFESKETIGSALIYKEKPIHMAFFKAVEQDNNERIAGLNRRRNFRYI